MRYYEVDKSFSFDSQYNVDVIKSYVLQHPHGHRVFSGNFDGFNASQLLNMLGFNVRFQKLDSGKYAPHAFKLHAYEEDAHRLLDLLDTLE